MVKGDSSRLVDLLLLENERGVESALGWIASFVCELKVSEGWENLDFGDIRLCVLPDIVLIGLLRSFYCVRGLVVGYGDLLSLVRGSELRGLM